MKMTKILFFFVSLAVAFVHPVTAGEAGAPSSAAGGQPADIDPERRARLEESVSGRWNALIEKDFAGAYEYFSPSYRKLFPLEHYVKQTGPNVDWLSVRILEIGMDGGRAKVRIQLDYRPALPPQAGFDDLEKMSTSLDEVWLWQDGSWWYVQQESGLSV